MIKNMGKKNKNQGFTLIEILVSVVILVSIFSIVSGLFFSALQSQRRALGLQSLLKEVSYAMEYMSRQLRMAQKDKVDTRCTTDGSDFKNYTTTASSVKFRSYHETAQCLDFFLENERLKVKRTIMGEPESGDFLTSEKIIVESFKVVAIGDGLLDKVQPKITIFLKARVKGEKPESQPEIQIQTTISQRNLDI
jgi:prepilin-type N-terminal cleavage/methylation domain-containing protein